MKKTIVISSCIAVIALFGLSIKKSSVELLIKSNVEALVADERFDVEERDLYFNREDGKKYGCFGEITTGNPNFTWCSNWMKTDPDWKHDKCYVPCDR